jgi:hypothetical protein
MAKFARDDIHYFARIGTLNLQQLWREQVAETAMDLADGVRRDGLTRNRTGLQILPVNRDWE